MNRHTCDGTTFGYNYLYIEIRKARNTPIKLNNCLLISSSLIRLAINIILFWLQLYFINVIHFIYKILLFVLFSTKSIICPNLVNTHLSEYITIIFRNCKLKTKASILKYIVQFDVII